MRRMKPRCTTRLATAWTLLASLSALCAADPALLKSEFIYETAPFPQCHASTIAETKAGLVAAWFGGTREKHPDVGIWVSRHVRGSWTPPVEVANGVQFHFTTGETNRHPCWNPVLFQAARGPLLLFYKAGPTPQTWWGMLTMSHDHGKTWDTPRRLPEGILGPIKNKPVQLADGSILAPTSYEDPQTDAWTVHFERTTDLGRTWTRTPALNDGKAISAIQPSVLFFGPRHLVAIGRSRQNKIFEIESTDGGRTWGAMRLGTLPNPNSGTDALTLKDGRHLIVYNHVPGEPGKWGGKRSPLNVAVSMDGRTWQAALVLEDEPGREFSYPAVIQAKDGLVHVTYTWKRQRVKHAVIDPEKLSLRPMVDGQWPR
jgi:predicted neuraminidase